MLRRLDPIRYLWAAVTLLSQARSDHWPTILAGRKDCAALGWSFMSPIIEDEGFHFTSTVDSWTQSCGIYTLLIFWQGWHVDILIFVTFLQFQNLSQVWFLGHVDMLLFFSFAFVDMFALLTFCYFAHYGHVGEYFMLVWFAFCIFLHLHIVANSVECQFPFFTFLIFTCWHVGKCWYLGKSYILACLDILIVWHFYNFYNLYMLVIYDILHFLSFVFSTIWHLRHFGILWRLWRYWQS